MSAVFIPYREVFMNYAGIKEYDIANGPGIRFSLFVSGCTHHCRGCFNPDTWSFHYGKPFTKETEDYIIRQLGQDCYQGMTLLGGEPMEPVNQKGLLPLVKRFKETYPEKDLWCFSGYLFDKEILGHFAKIMPETMELLKYIDILVDGQPADNRCAEISPCRRTVLLESGRHKYVKNDKNLKAAMQKGTRRLCRQVPFYVLSMMTGFTVV